MSGPKIVRIVTRDEVIATCRAHLARLDSAVDAYTHYCKKRDLANEAELAAIEKRRVDLHSLLTKDAFLDLQKRVPQEIAFLENDRQERVKTAAEAAARLKASLQSAKTLANQIVPALQQANAPLEVIVRLRGIAKGDIQDLAQVNAILAEAYNARMETSNTSEMREQLALADRLGGASGPTTFAQWRGQHEPQDNADDRAVQASLAALELQIDDDAVVVAFRERWAQIEPEKDAQLRGLRRDSLFRDLQMALNEARERTRLLETLSAHNREWRMLNPTIPVPWIRNTGAGEQSLVYLRELSAVAKTDLAAETKRQATVSRREAVLAQLAALGYEIREGLQTALAQDGNVILRKAAAPDYGVEVIASATGDKLSFRAIAFGVESASRNQTRDADMEVLWCGDFDRLKTELEKVGGHVMIEKAVPAGEQAVKLIVVESTERPQGEPIGIPHARSLKD